MPAFLIGLLLVVASIAYILSARRPARVYLPIQIDDRLRRRKPRY